MEFFPSRMLLVLAAVVVGGCAAPATREPPNLYPHKQQIRAYVTGGDYGRDIADVAQRAEKWIEARASAGGTKLTVVFDLDETLLMNWPLFSRLDFAYINAEWEKWVEDASAPAIERVREVYRTARRRDLDV